MMPVGISGIGDIVALLNIVRGFAEAIDGSRGSAAEYQEVQRELKGLEEALKCHQQLLQARRDDPALNAIFRSTQNTAEDCQRCIEVFSKQTVQFDRSLGVGNGGNVCKDVTRKVRWHMEKKQEVMRFRAELSQHISTLNMLFGLANLNMQRIATETVDARLDTLTVKIDSNTEAQSSSFKGLQEQVDHGNMQLVATVKNLHEELKVGWLGNVLSELKERVSQVFFTTGTTLSAVQRIETILLSRADKTLFRTFILEDALGLKTQHDLMCINSWDSFDAMIEIIFRDRPCHGIVAKKQYVLEDQETSREIKRSTPWSTALLPDQHIIMGLLFRKRASPRKRIYCPYCHLAQMLSDEGQPCRNTKCGMSHERRTEIIDIKEDEDIPTFDLIDAQGSDSEDYPEDLDEEKTSQHVTNSGKSAHPIEAKEDMSVFKRIIVVEVEMNVLQSKSTELTLEQATPYKQSPSSQSQSRYDEQRANSYSYRASYGDYQEDTYEYVDYVIDDTVYRVPARQPREIHYSRRHLDRTSPNSEAQYVYERGTDPVYEPYRHQSVSVQERLPQRRRESTATGRLSKSQSKRPSPPSKKRLAPRATEADARKHRIKPPYSLKNWDPSEEPIRLLDSIFDANSLGKWIYDWTVHHHGPATPIADMAGELWLLLIQLAGKIKRAEGCMARIRKVENRDMVEDFIESGERLTDKFKKLLKSCEQDISIARSTPINIQDSTANRLKHDQTIPPEPKDLATSPTTTPRSQANGPDDDDGMTTSRASMADTEDDWGTRSRKPTRRNFIDKQFGIDFVESVFGRNRQLEQTERFMSSIRLWNLRFDANCEDILQRPLQ